MSVLNLFRTPKCFRAAIPINGTERNLSQPITTIKNGSRNTNSGSPFLKYIKKAIPINETERSLFPNIITIENGLSQTEHLDVFRAGISINGTERNLPLPIRNLPLPITTIKNSSRNINSGKHRIRKVFRPAIPINGTERNLSQAITIIENGSRNTNSGSIFS
eukprot:Pgem_evm2s675